MSKKICEEFSKLFRVINLEKQCKISLLLLNSFSSVQSLSHVRLSATPWTTADQASLSITNSQNLLKLMSIESVMPSNHLILCRPLLPPSIFPSIGVFSNESVFHIRWPKYWSISFSISPSNEYSGLISFRMDWLDLLAVHESWPDTNRRLWTQGFQRETLRAILHLELLLTFARSQTSMEAAAAAAAAAAKSLQSCLTAANACK